MNINAIIYLVFFFLSDSFCYALDLHPLPKNHHSHNYEVYIKQQSLNIDGQVMNFFPSRWHRYEVYYKATDTSPMKTQNVIGRELKNTVESMRAKGWKVIKIESLVSIVPYHHGL